MVSSLHGNSYQVFRALLVSAREQAGLTQVQVAKLLGKPQSYVSKYERGERRLDFTEFMALADILDLDIQNFIVMYKSQTS